MADKGHTAVTISRQMGSGGTYIGYLLSRELGFKYIDREILQVAAEHLKTDADWLEHFDERSSGLLANILRGLALGTPETMCTFPLSRPVYDRDLFALECKIMNDMLDLHDAVFIGRAGFHALKDHPGVISIFIHAPLEFRIERIMKVQNITDIRQARDEIEKSDQRKARYIQDMVGVNWTDSLNYHLTIDSSTVSFDAGVGMIKNLLAR
ncbi:MAG TPA: cytidylate kinase-like family protein [Deltaproteobacteria bacterium]|nr:cytidylate kinase-like family protein [Deltaproteobacteria bacterium]HPI93649.1 cytidylate kinase-like family protein [Deltaproteobacteria bacterium]HPR54569.1 cytidylate kinase-like family protein [Deltaproteobacteria bacterium]